MQKFGYIYDTLHLPHDAESKTIGSNGRSIEEIVELLATKLMYCREFLLQILLTLPRTIFTSCYFDRTNCEEDYNVFVIIVMMLTQTLKCSPVFHYMTFILMVRMLFVTLG
jgi:hypothetical protein